MPGSRHSRNLVKRAQPWLGTYVEIRAHSAHRSRWQLMAAIDAAFAEVAAIHRLLSRQERGADFVGLATAAAGETVHVDVRTAEVLRLALELRQESGGRFDPERGDGRERSHDRARMDAPWVIDGRDSVHVLRRAIPDLDGIAKGYAVDRAIEILQSERVAAAVNAGGDLRSTGESMEPLLVRCPPAPGGILNVGWLGKGAFATSQAGRTELLEPDLAGDGVEDRRAGAEPLPSATVCVAAPSCAVADALTKVVAVDPAATGAMLGSRSASAWILRASPRGLCLQRHGASDIVKLDAA